jgi:hypothetical protein
MMNSGGEWNQSVARKGLWSRLRPETAFWTTGRLYRQGKTEADLELIHVKHRANIQAAGSLLSAWRDDLAMLELIYCFR